MLFPINHGILYYPGTDVLPPFVVHGTIRVDDQRFEEIADALRARLSDLEKIEPIRYRRQGGGDYDRDLRLLDGREGNGTSGFRLHIAS